MLFDLDERKEIESFLLPPKSHLLYYSNLYEQIIKYINELIKKSGDISEIVWLGNVKYKLKQRKKELDDTFTNQ